jgi:hypothetical protein
MAEVAAHLLDHVIPLLRVHQRALPMPKRLRHFL